MDDTRRLFHFGRGDKVLVPRKLSDGPTLYEVCDVVRVVPNGTDDVLELIPAGMRDPLQVSFPTFTRPVWEVLGVPFVAAGNWGDVGPLLHEAYRVAGLRATVGAWFPHLASPAVGAFAEPPTVAPVATANGSRLLFEHEPGDKVVWMRAGAIEPFVCSFVGWGKERMRLHVPDRYRVGTASKCPNVVRVDPWLVVPVALGFLTAGSGTTKARLAEAWRKHGMAAIAGDWFGEASLRPLRAKAGAA